MARKKAGQTVIFRRTKAVDTLPVQTAEELLATPARQAQLREIAQLCTVPATHFDTLYQNALLAFAALVQQLPASESHHHCGPGGMLDHTLEVVVVALRLRRGMLLPAGAGPEALAKKADLWTYAVFAGALLHDIGKPLVDQRVTLVDPRGSAVGLWNPWMGTMPPKHAYRVTFVRDRRYPLHEKVAALVARQIIPAHGFAWLASDTEVLAAVIAALDGGQDGSPVRDLVGKADGASVARNLGAGGTPRFAGARIGLHEKLLAALRHLIASGDIPLNRNGAAGWLTGDDCWLVSKRVVDTLRDHLTREGHDGIPTRNDRIFDILQEHGILTPNGGQAIWRARVASPAWDAAHELTLLRLSAAMLWPDADARPAAFDGSVTPLAGPVPSVRPDDTPPRAAPAPSAPPAATAVPTPPATEWDTRAESVAHADSWDPAPPANIPASTDPTPDTPRTASKPPSACRDTGPFLAWVRSEVAQRRLLINQVDARVHVVPEGALLISPALFRDYARAVGDEGGWEHAQKKFVKLRLHTPAPDGSNITYCRVELPGGENRGPASMLKCILVPDMTLIFGDTPPPPPNPTLRVVAHPRIRPPEENATQEKADVTSDS